MADLMIPVGNVMSDAEFSKLASSNKFLPRLQLFSSRTTLVQRGEFKGGNFGLVTGKDQVKDLSNSVDCLPINVRAKAMDLSGEKPITVFDKDSDEFNRIMDESAEKDSNCLWGPEFLMWLPYEQVFATFFCANPTHRREAPNIKKLIGRPATLKSQWIESKQYGGWHGPVITACSTPFDPPDLTLLNEEVNNFLNPPASVQLEEVGVEPDRAR